MWSDGYMWSDGAVFSESLTEPMTVNTWVDPQ